MYDGGNENLGEEQMVYVGLKEIPLNKFFTLLFSNNTVAFLFISAEVCVF